MSNIRTVLITLLIFAVSATVEAATLTTIHSFAGSPHDGNTPSASVALGPGGVLYGTTYYGGVGNCGAVFSLTPPTTAGDAWTRSLYSFPGNGPDGSCIGGANPVAGLTVAREGMVLYGSTQAGGNCTNGGTIFELRPPMAPASAWAESVLLNVCGSGGYLGGPDSSPVVGNGGVLYATTRGVYLVSGSVFSLTPPASPGESWSQTVLHTFAGGRDGTQPNGAALGSGGQLYGTTETGGASGCYGDFDGCGILYSLTPPKSNGAPWVETILHNFDDRIGDGTSPIGPVLIGTGGALYGTTEAGAGGSVGNYCNEGCGSIFSLIPPGASGEGEFTVLYQFTGALNGDGAVPSGGLTAFNGVLYGTTQWGGVPGCFDGQGCGTIFSLAPPASPGGSWTETVLYRFTGGANGSSPNGSLAVDSHGVLYGTTYEGGAFNEGTVFSFTP